MTVLIDHAAAVVPSVDGIDPAGWLARFDEMIAEVAAPAFFRREPRLRSRSYLLGLVSGWSARTGGRWRSLPGRPPRWDATAFELRPVGAGAVRDALGRYVAFHLGDPAAVPAAATSPVTSGIKHL